MLQTLVIAIGKTVRRASKLRGGNGSALPGLVVEKISPDFMARTLSQLPMGVVVISGTNGKTTTTKMVTQLLTGSGLRVFTNKTGSNFTRGVVAELISAVDIHGHLDADIAVLELDEAYAVKFSELVPPTYCLLLNVMRDQLDRFGEIDNTAKLLEKVALSTTDKVVLNHQDNRLVEISQKLKSSKVLFFGLSDKLKKTFPNDDDLHQADSVTPPTSKPSTPLSVTLVDISGQEATFSIGKQDLTTNLKISGLYNVYNAAGALALVKAIIPGVDNEQLLAELSNITPAFGRGETFNINDSSLEVVLVKNPSGFQLGLESFSPKGVSTMIAINDNYADGRDMSWLWDVDFTSLPKVSMVSGIRAYDMALRLSYSDIPIDSTDTDINKAVANFISNSPNTKLRIFCTYTAMLQIRKELAKYTKVENIT